MTLITDNKKFCKEVKPLFSDKLKTQSKMHRNCKMVPVENDEVITDDRQVAETCKNYFVTVTGTHGMAENLGNFR